MSQTLTQLAQIRSQVRIRLLLRGIACFLSVLLAALLIAGLLDWLLQLESSIGRWITLFCLLALSLWSAWRWLIRPLRRRISLTDIALQLERQDSQWGGRLAAHADLDEHANSGDIPQLEHAWKTPTALPWRPVLWPAAGLVGLCFVIGFLLTTYRQHVHVAFIRTVLPAEQIRWPRTTRLKLVTRDGTLLNATRAITVNSGQPLTLHARDEEGPPPKQVIWEIKHPGGRIEKHAAKQTSRSGKGQGFQFTWIPDKGESWIRVRGGDDDSMAWHPVQSVTPPRLLSTDVVLTYPSYLAMPPAELSHLPTKLSLPVGTQIEIRGTTDRPVSKVELHLSGRPTRDVEVAPDQTSFTWRSLISTTDRIVYWFNLTDTSGVTARHAPRHEFIPVADALCAVRIVKPEGDLFVTPSASVPLELAIQDDFGVQAVELVVRQAESSQVAWKQQWTSDIASEQRVAARFQLSQEADSQREALVITSPLGQLTEGTVVELSVRGRDFAPGDDRWSESPRRVFHIVSSAEKTQELIQRVLTHSRSLHDQLRSLHALQTEMQQASTSDEPDNTALQMHQKSLQRLQQVLLSQRQLIQSELGIVAQFVAVIDEADNNRLDTEALATPLGHIVRRLEALNEQTLPSAQQELADATEQVRILLDDNQTLADWLRSSNGNSTRLKLAVQSTVNGWQEIVDMLATWSRQRDYIDRFDELFAHLKSLREQTIPVGQRTLGIAFAKLAPNDRAALADIANDHRLLAFDFRELEQPSEEETQDALFRQIAPKLQEADTSTNLQQIAEAVGRNNIGQAMQSQQDIIRKLEEIVQLLKGDIPKASENSIRGIAAARRELEDLFFKQKQLLERMSFATLSEDAESRALLERLTKQHEELLNTAERLSRNLQDIGLDIPATHLADAARHVRESRLLLPRQRTEESKNHLQNAQNSIQEALEEVQRLESMLQQQLVTASMQNAGETLRGLSLRQDRLADETTRLRNVFTNTGRWTRGELKSLLDLSRAQSQLANELIQLRLEVVDLSLFQAVAADLEDRMKQCAEQLGQRDVSDQTEQSQRDIARQLKIVADSFAATGPQSTASASSGEQPSQGTETEPEFTALQEAELRLIAALQLDLANRTEELLNSNLTGDQLEERRQQLANEQERLSRWLRSILEADEVPKPN
ncbi:MAG: hypothetical protein H6824_24195 [Planctomycetaceae bacterium]|nr:hypothetical protein [Planctomycetaceae bacterium]